MLEWLTNNKELIGFIAAGLGTFSLIPQVIQTWRSHSVGDISLIMYLMMSINSILWVIYAFALSSTPLIVQSAIIFTCASSIVTMKLIWK
jgi:MtN3 and saliva related transmembrane protein